jgi:hypothetical protein
LLPRRENEVGRCVHCSTTLEPWEGQPAPRYYSYTATEIAHALALVAYGESYRRAAQAARALAQRELHLNPGSLRRRLPESDGQLVANWVDVFAPIVLSSALPEAWPEELLVDETTFKVNRGCKAGARYHVFCAVGYVLDGYVRKPRLWRLESFGSGSERSWRKFFRSLEGCPRIVLTDMASQIRNAARSVFDQRGQAPVELFFCEYHLRERLAETLAPLRQVDPSHELFRVLEQALLSPDKWERLLELVDEVDRNVVRLPATIRWLRRFGKEIALQVERRYDANVHSLGAAESYLHKLRGTLSERSRVLGNRRRTNLLLGLLALGLMGEVDELAWAEAIRSHLAQYEGRPLPQRRHDDRFGMPSLFVP